MADTDTICEAFYHFRVGHIAPGHMSYIRVPSAATCSVTRLLLMETQTVTIQQQGHCATAACQPTVRLFIALFKLTAAVSLMTQILHFRGRVFALDFGTMRVCDLEFDCVRRLTTPPNPTTNANPTPSSHTVWKYYCRDNFGWREYSEVSHSLKFVCTLCEHEARHINFVYTDQLSSCCDGINFDAHAHSCTQAKCPL